MIGIGQKFPSFALTGVVSNDIKTAFQPFDNNTAAGKWQIVFFWPKDFTFVCPTETRSCTASAPTASSCTSRGAAARTS
jgi:alkyl hydroperoxide reductase subunit AhpC